MATLYTYAVILSWLFIQGLDALQYSSVARIYPERADITVDAGTNLTLGCRGGEPMLWTFQDDYNGPNFTNSNINITNMFNSEKNEYKFETILTVYNVSSKQIGFYYCHGAAADFNTPRRSNRIYIFVHGECPFTLNNEPTVEHVCTWATKYPRINVCTNTQYHNKINIWAGISTNQIIGPFEIMKNLSTNSYLELLQNNVGLALKDTARRDQDVRFQHNGCPAHCGLYVREYLDSAYPNRRIGRSDGNQLSVIPSEEYKFLDAEWIVFVPCRPTSHDINITVTCEDYDKTKTLTMSVHPGNYTAVHEGEDHVGKFHSYHGYEFYYSSGTHFIWNCSCISTRENATSVLNLAHTYIPDVYLLGIPVSIEGPTTANVEENITLQCAYMNNQYLPVDKYWIQWEVPASGNKYTKILQVIKIKPYVFVRSIIKINNISNEDEGGYKCRWDNDLYGAEVSTYVYVNDKKNKANAPRISSQTGGEVQINAGANITLRCEGPRPVTWTRGQVTESYSVEHINVGGRYETYLYLTNVSYKNVGFYICYQNDSEINHPFHSDSIYMFVEDAQYLYVPQEEKNNGVDLYSNVTVPCLPTSRDVNVSLSMLHAPLDSNTRRRGPRQNMTPVIYSYDPREGFAVQMPGLGRATATCTFVTETARDTIEIHYDIFVYGFYKETELLIAGPQDDLVFVGQTLELSCAVFVLYNVPDDALRWTPPNDVTTSIHIVEIKKMNYHNGKVIVSKLTLHDVGASNDGRYFCHSLHNNGTTSKVITVYDMFPVNKPSIEYVHYNYAYIGQPLILRCKVIVNHNVGYRMSWTTPDNTEIQNPNIEYISTIRNTSGEIILKIQNTTEKNAGNYSCNVFYTTNHRNGTSKHIIVKRGDAPRIVASNFKNQEEIFMVVGEIVTLACSAKGDPQPVITWMKGSSAVRRLDPYIDFAANNSELIVRSSPEFDAGLYTCVAQNPFGRDSCDVHLRLTTALSIPYTAVVVLLVILFIVASVALARWSYRRKMFSKKLIKDGFMNLKSRELQGLLNIAEQTALLPYDTKWEIPRNNIELGRNLGSGYFGLVVEATVSNFFDGEPEKTVAVKMVHRYSNVMELNSLICELKIMTHVGEHVNLIKLLGASAGRIAEGNLLVVIEYCEHGSLRNYLIENRSNFVNLIDPDTELICFPDTNDDTDSLQDFVCASDAEANDGDGDETTRPAELNTLQLLRWALQVAHGMQFLASKQILHGDLALRNVLLAANSVVKICDFGLSKTLSSSGYYKKSSQCPLPIKWMAIESIRYKTFSTQSDVWAFGVVLWELFSLARTPYAELEVDFRFYRLLESGHRLQRPDYSTREIYQVMRECWSDWPQTRPTFSCLAQTLTDLLQDPNKRCSAEIDECAAASVLAAARADPAAPDWVALDILPSSSSAAGILETHL